MGKRSMKTPNVAPRAGRASPPGMIPAGIAAPRWSSPANPAPDCASYLSIRVR